MLRRTRTALALVTVVLALVGLACPVTAFAADGDDLDFDDGGQDDFVVFRPIVGTWFLLSAEDGVQRSYQWGLPGDIPVPGQYSDNLRPDIAVYRPSDGVWYMRRWDNTLEFAQTNAVQWGGFPGDIPVPCNYNGSSRQDIGIYRGGLWFVRYAPEFEDDNVVAWGSADDLPVPRDFDNDDQCDFAVFRNGTWAILLSTRDYQEAATVSWGAEGDIPLPANFSGNSHMHDIAVYRPGNPSLWIFREASRQGLTSRVIPWGVAGDVPLATDFDGDDRSDIVVWRPSEGTFYALTSSSSFQNTIVQPWGLYGDTPLAQDVRPRTQ